MAENTTPENPYNLTPEERAHGLTHAYSKEIIYALEQKDKKTLRKLLNSMHTADIADFVDVISHEHRRMFVEMTKEKFNPEILVELSLDVKEEILELLGVKQSAAAINSLDMDDAVDVIEDLSIAEQRQILGEMTPKQREELEGSLAYPADSAGRLVTNKVVSVPEFWDVGQTIDYLRSAKDLPDEFYQIFIADPKMKPIGAVLLSRVMRSGRHVKMKDVMNTNLKTIRADMDQEEAAFIFRQYGLASAPVVNEEGRMIGIITVDDIVHVIEEEAQEDIMHMGGISETDLYSGFFSTVSRRFPWLLANLITAILASIVIAFFEGTIQKLAALAVLMPIVASMGGNAGTQTVTIVVRAIATKELTTTNALRAVGKEVMVGCLNGLIFAVITGILAYMWLGDIYLSVAFGVAMICTLFLAGVSGALIPIGMVKLGVDPAIASTVILTTVTDVTAFATFLGFATLIMFH